MNSSLNHNEFKEQIAAYVAGGLKPAERVAFEDHLAVCEKCAAEFAEIIEMDQAMTNTFAIARPTAGMEDRIIQRLRLVSSRRLFLRFWPCRPAISGPAICS